MKIGIDGREIQDGVYTGIGRALYDLLKYMDQSAEDEVVVFSAKPLAFKSFSKVRNHVIGGAVTLWWDQVKLPAAIRQERVDIFYSPYYKVPFSASCRKVCAVLDLINLRFSGYRQKISWAQWLFYQVVLPWHLKAADTVVTSSGHACDDILRTYGLEPAKVKVVPLAVSDCFQPQIDAKRMLEIRNWFAIPGPYIVYVGNFKGHKNVAALIDAFALLVEEYAHLSLVLVGPKAHGYDALVERCLKDGLEGRVIFTGKVVDEEVGQLLYAGAEVCVMPSLYEGFGLPPIEAMACGTPVVCSSATSLPEVVDDAALLVDPSSPLAIAQAVRSLLRHEDIRRAFVDVGLGQAAKFRPDIVMPRMLDAIKGVGV